MDWMDSVLDQGHAYRALEADMNDIREAAKHGAVLDCSDEYIREGLLALIDSWDRGLDIDDYRE